MISNKMSALSVNRERPLFRLALVCVATFMVYLDTSITPVAVPAIRADLHAGVTAAQWLLDAYTLGFAGLLLTAGSLGDRFGRKAVLLAGTAGFSACSVACALAPNPPALIAARAGQGVFAAAVVPLSLAVTSALFADARQRSRAIGVWGGTAGVALALGPLVGGLLVQTAGWESLFWINLPIGATALAGLAWSLEGQRRCDHGSVASPEAVVPGALPGTGQTGPGGGDAGHVPTRRVDAVGQLLFILGTGALTVVMIEGGGYGWHSPMTVGLACTSIVALAFFALWELRCRQPMLPPRLLRIPAVAVACAVNFLGLFGLYAVLFLLTLYLQDSLHLSPLETGVRFLALTGFLGIGAVSAAGVVRRLGTRTTMVLGLLLVTLGLGGLTLVETGNGYFSYGWALVLIGVGIPLSSGVVAIQAMMAAVPADLAGTAAGTMNTFRQFGAVFGVALAGLLSPQRSNIVTSMYRTFTVAAAGALAGAMLTAIVLRERRARAAETTPAGAGHTPERIIPFVRMRNSPR